MRRLHFILSALTLAVSAVLAVSGAARAAPPQVGDRAPDFLLHGTDGDLYRLSEQLGKRGVVVAWFPKAFTPG